MPLSDTTVGAASTGTSDKTFWTAIQSFFTTLVLGCFVDHARNKRTPVPAALIWRLLSQLLAVTIHIHHEVVIHRDIKASNVFLHWKADDASLPDFFLGDFGIACRRSDRANGFGQHIFDFRMLFNLAKLAANRRAVSSGTVPAPRGRGGESIAALFRVFEKFDRALLNFETMRDKEEFMQGMCELEKEVKGEKEMRKEDQMEYKLEV